MSVLFLQSPEDDDLILRHAVRTYAEACALEARGEYEDAIVLYRRAFALERALDSDETEWPAWLIAAAEQHERASDAPLAPIPEPVRHVELAPSQPTKEAVASDALAQLRRSGYACIDRFVNVELAEAAGAEISAAHAAGRLAPGEVGSDGPSAHVSAKRRGDWVAHVGESEHGWTALRNACAAVDNLAAELRPALALGGASRPMATRYSDGACYAMHFDNACHDRPRSPARARAELPPASIGASAPAVPESRMPQKAGASAPCPNERRLTCVLYLTRNWQPGDGGELRLYRSNRSERSQDERHTLTRAEVSPVAGRLLLFWSDWRCPHEVLPAWRERLAVTVWYGRDGAACAD